jgi:hypothetical protein
LFHEVEPRERTALAVVGALVVGLLSGFAGGFVVGQRGVSLPSPRSAADVPGPDAGPFTEAAIAEPVPPPAPPAPPPAAPPSSPGTSVPGTQLLHRRGVLQVVSRPPGAQVFLDGAFVGRTPLVASDVAAGSRRVRLELAGHRPWSTSVDVEPGARVRVGASLER